MTGTADYGIYLKEICRGNMLHDNDCSGFTPYLCHAYFGQDASGNSADFLLGDCADFACCDFGGNTVTCDVAQPASGQPADVDINTEVDSTTSVEQLSAQALLPISPDTEHITVLTNGDIEVTPAGAIERFETHPWASEITAAGTGVPGASTACTEDVHNIQWAVDHVAEGGTVILKTGTYEFGDGWITPPTYNYPPLPPSDYFIPRYVTSGTPSHADFVGFKRNLTIKGEGMPKIVGGFATFRTYDEVDLTIDGIHFDAALGSAILVPAANNVVIKNNKVTNTEVTGYIPQFEGKSSAEWLREI